MKIGIIGSDLGNLLIAAKFADVEGYELTIFEKDKILGNDFAPVELSDGTKCQLAYNTFIDEDEFLAGLKKFNINLPLNAVLNMHQMYAVIYGDNQKIVKYNNMFETIETLRLSPAEKKRFELFYNKWQMNYNTAKAYTTNDISKQYYNHGIINRLKDTVFQSFSDETSRLNSEKVENLYQVLPLLLDQNPTVVSRQHHYLTIQEHTRGMAYFNRANTNLYDEILKKINNAKNINVKLETPVLNYYRKNIITPNGKEIFDLIIDGTASHVDQKKYKNIGLKTPKIVISLDCSYPNLETNIIYNGNNSLTKNLKGKSKTDISLKVHNPFAVQANVESSKIFVTPIGLEQTDKLIIEQQIIPILEKIGFHKIKSHIKAIDIFDNGNNIYRAQMSKLFANKLMIESATNNHLLYNCKPYGYGAQLNQVIKTANKVTQIIESRKNEE